jgi:hypothetical protein
MKEISEYTLKECLEEVEMLHGGYGYRDPEKLADRIHELTRWIPLSESMPTANDGNVLLMHDGGYVEYSPFGFADIHTHTHWQRITPPEGA